EPSRLPITLFDMSNRPALLKASIATNAAALLKLPTKLVVWSIPEIVLPWIKVAVELLTVTTLIPRNVLSRPLIIVVPVPAAFPNPITFHALGRLKPTELMAPSGRLLPAGPMSLLEMVLLLTPDVALAVPKKIIAEAEPRIVQFVIVLNWAPLSKKIVDAKL